MYSSGPSLTGKFLTAAAAEEELGLPFAAEQHSTTAFPCVHHRFKACTIHTGWLVGVEPSGHDNWRILVWAMNCTPEGDLQSGVKMLASATETCV